MTLDEGVRRREHSEPVNRLSLGGVVLMRRTYMAYMSLVVFLVNYKEEGALRRDLSQCQCSLISCSSTSALAIID